MCFREWRVGIVKCDYCRGSGKEPAGTALNPYNDGMPSPPCSKCHGTGEVRPPPIFPQKHACDDCPGGIFPHVECRECLIIPKRLLPKLSPDFYAKRAEMIAALEEKKPTPDGRKSTSQIDAEARTWQKLTRSDTEGLKEMDNLLKVKAREHEVRRQDWNENRPSEICPRCGGSGKTKDDEVGTIHCPACGGTGKTEGK